MLVLTRKVEEEIKIGNDITVSVVQANNGSVKLGIEAPEDVSFCRAEMKEKGRREKEQPFTLCARIL